MTNTNFTGPRADQIYRVGPESLVAESSAVATGNVTHYSKVVTSVSAGTEPIPLTWTVKGEIEQPLAIKGVVAASPVSFTKKERSPIAADEPNATAWQLEYGEIRPGGIVVLFFQGSPETPSVVLPGGQDAQALITLLRDIVRIQELSTPDKQIAAWLDYLERTRTEEALEVALRSLVRLGVRWSALSPILQGLVANTTTSFHDRRFMFGIVAFAVTLEKFTAQQSDAVKFLCNEFVAAKDTRLCLQYILNLKLLLRYTGQSEGRQRRLLLEQQIISALKRRASSGPLAPEIEEQYRQIQDTHPELRS